MAYTHTFQISIEGINVEGEMSFNGGEAAKFKTSASEEMTILQHRKIQDFFEKIVNFHNTCAEISKIEIVKKT